MTLKCTNNIPNDFPLKYLEDAILNSVKRISPEKQDEISLSDYSVEFSNVEQFGFYTDTKNKIIYLPIKSLHYLWAISYISLSIHYKYVRAQEKSDKENLNESDLIFEISLLTLFERYFKNECGECEIGREFIKLSDCNSRLDINEQDINNDAGEIFLCAMAWIILHEIGHIVSGHQNEELSNSRQEELQADEFATKYILHDNIKDDENGSSIDKKNKRTLGIILAITAILFKDIKDNGGDRSHPNAHERMWGVLDNIEKDNEKLVCLLFPMLLLFYYSKHNKVLTICENEENYIDFVSQALIALVRMEN
ncbi:TPA: hypothetical protein U2I44_003779 [Providencia rettgeri]|nr:hypothetical protein [Providencia rettgeri]